MKQPIWHKVKKFYRHMYHVKTYKDSSWGHYLNPKGSLPFWVYSAIFAHFWWFPCCNLTNSYRLYQTNLKFYLYTLEICVNKNYQKPLFWFNGVMVVWQPFASNFSIHYYVNHFTFDVYLQVKDTLSQKAKRQLHSHMAGDCNVMTKGRDAGCKCCKKTP